MKTSNKLVRIFGCIERPRSHINQLHNIADILLIVIILVICGVETWKQVIGFSVSKEVEISTDIDFGHGRIETRKCSVISEFQFIDNTDNEWNKLNQLIKIESIREFKNSDKEVEKATRYDISSLQDNAKNYQQNIRSHWGVENKLRWILDIAFSEDASRKRNKNAAQNYSILLKITLNLLKNEKLEKQGVAGKRLKAG